MQIRRIYKFETNLNRNTKKRFLSEACFCVYVVVNRMHAHLTHFFKMLFFK